MFVRDSNHGGVYVKFRKFFIGLRLYCISKVGRYYFLQTHRQSVHDLGKIISGQQSMSELLPSWTSTSSPPRLRYIFYEKPKKEQTHF
jgi:hypothetical protein